ncbi:hypothetical protein [Gardnerella vaginalis]|uniref:hypothetical protein n=1 Tax=Gardnerella vaginalis TaxID=2702 RepID=UPI001FF2914F|nr:hypothetical protein [Gardnerella vaginalis]
MHTYYEWKWLIQRTEQCARNILAEAEASELNEWQGIAAQYFRHSMSNIASQAYSLYEIRGGM